MIAAALTAIQSDTLPLAGRASPSLPSRVTPARSGGHSGPRRGPWSQQQRPTSHLFGRSLVGPLLKPRAAAVPGVAP